MLDTKILTLIINEVGNLTIRRDNQYYRLQLIIKSKDLNTSSLDTLICNIRLDYLFNYDYSNNTYYLYGSKVVQLLEQLVNCTYLLSSNNYIKFNSILSNKELFTRSKGKRLSIEELTALEQLHLEFKKLND